MRRRRRPGEATLDAEIVRRPESWILGVPARIRPSEADYKDLWENRFMPRHEEIRSVAVESGYSAAYFPCDEAGQVDFVAGMRVEESALAPPGLVLRTLPSGAYTLFRCRMAEIGATWGAIHREWLPSSPYEEDEERPAIEQDPPESSGTEPGVEIFLANRPKEAYP